MTLLERGAVGRESSWAGGGILSPLYPWRYAEPVTALATWSQARYASFAEQLLAETGIDPEWTQSGLLVLDAEAEAGPWAQRHDVRLEWLDSEATERCEPRLGEHGPRAAWLPAVAQIRNPRLAQALQAALDQTGVTIREHTSVERLIIDRGRVAGVKTRAGRFDAEAVIVAGGAWSSELLGEWGGEVEVEPVRGQMLLFRAEPGLVSRLVLDQGRYVIPRRDGRVLVGSTLERVGFDKATTFEALDELRAAAYRLIPALREFPIERHWAGLRPGSPEGVPYIAAHPEVSGLYVNTGQYRNGVVLGLASGRLMGDIVLGRAPILDPMPYAPGVTHGKT